MSSAFLGHHNFLDRVGAVLIVSILKGGAGAYVEQGKEMEARTGGSFLQLYQFSKENIKGTNLTGASNSLDNWSIYIT